MSVGVLLCLTFRNAQEKVACVYATTLRDQKRLATEKLFDSENSDATPTVLRNVVKLLPSLLPNTGTKQPTLAFLPHH